mmetsp:Transcript_37713/g.67348  ORF Transcript_37713/g.67348 Transcript_37713/m.67348 type:complete len:550 (-) Transcript_37713:91-1740(-)
MTDEADTCREAFVVGAIEGGGVMPAERTQKCPCLFLSRLITLNQSTSCSQSFLSALLVVNGCHTHGNRQLPGSSVDSICHLGGNLLNQSGDLLDQLLLRWHALQSLDLVRSQQATLHSSTNDSFGALVLILATRLKESLVRLDCLLNIINFDKEPCIHAHRHGISSLETSALRSHAEEGVLHNHNFGVPWHSVAQRGELADRVASNFETENQSGRLKQCLHLGNLFHLPGRQILGQNVGFPVCTHFHGLCTGSSEHGNGLPISLNIIIESLCIAIGNLVVLVQNDALASGSLDGRSGGVGEGMSLNLHICGDFGNFTFLDTTNLEQVDFAASLHRESHSASRFGPIQGHETNHFVVISAISVSRSERATTVLGGTAVQRGLTTFKPSSRRAATSGLLTTVPETAASTLSCGMTTTLALAFLPRVRQGRKIVQRQQLVVSNTGHRKEGISFLLRSNQTTQGNDAGTQDKQGTPEQGTQVQSLGGGGCVGGERLGLVLWCRLLVNGTQSRRIPHVLSSHGSVANGSSGNDRSSRSHSSPRCPKLLGIGSVG